VEKILLFNKFSPLSIFALVMKMQPHKVVRWCTDDDFLRPIFPVSHMQHISDPH